MPVVTVNADGSDVTLTGTDGTSVMRLIQATGRPNFGECEGSLACATCHVVVDPAWAGKLPPPNDDEEAMLDTAFNLQPTSRLSCQIVLGAALDGIRVTLP